MAALDVKYAVNCSILLTDLPLLERPSAAFEKGFESVEFWWPFESARPTDHQVSGFVRSILDSGVNLTALNFWAGDMSAGERGAASHPERSAEFRDSVHIAVSIAESTGCRAFNALYGNRLPGRQAQEQDDTAVENLAFACREAETVGSVVLIEPLSAAPTYPLLSSADVFGVLRQVQHASPHDNIRLLADFYHLASNGEDVMLLVEAHAREFGHIQIADAPGRGVPGSGTLPIAQWLKASYEGGYTGSVGLEFKCDQLPNLGDIGRLLSVND